MGGESPRALRGDWRVVEGAGENPPPPARKDLVEIRPFCGHISTVFQRHILPLLQEALAEDPVVFLRGPRQSGKTTLVKSLATHSPEARQYRTLDDLATLSAARSDPVAFVSAVQAPITIDEVQRVPELLLAIKKRVDEDRTPGRFLLTGSAEVRLGGAVAESLAGRMRVLDLGPLSQAELEGTAQDWLNKLWDGIPPSSDKNTVSREALIHKILRGGFPEAATRKTLAGAQRWLQSYADALIERDMNNLARVGDVSHLRRLLALAGSRTATVVNYADFARILGVPLTTVRRYVALAQAVFFAFEIPAWAGNTSARLVRQPKLHVSDTGIACVLAGLDERSCGSQAIFLGQLFETFVVSEIRKAISCSPIPWSLCHFRSHAGREVDAVLEARDGSVCGVEMKFGATVRSEDFGGLRYLRDVAGRNFRGGYVIYTGDDVVSLAPDLHALPVSAIW